MPPSTSSLLSCSSSKLHDGCFDQLLTQSPPPSPYNYKQYCFVAFPTFCHYHPPHHHRHHHLIKSPITNQYHQQHLPPLPPSNYEQYCSLAFPTFYPCHHPRHDHHRNHQDHDGYNHHDHGRVMTLLLCLISLSIINICPLLG